MRIFYLLVMLFFASSCTLKNQGSEPVNDCEIDRTSWCIMGSAAKVSFESVHNEPFQKWTFLESVGDYKPFVVLEHQQCVGLKNPTFDYSSVAADPNKIDLISKKNSDCFLRFSLPDQNLDRELAIDLMRSLIKICVNEEDGDCKMNILESEFYDSFK